MLNNRFISFRLPDFLPTEAPKKRLLNSNELLVNFPDDVEQYSGFKAVMFFLNSRTITDSLSDATNPDQVPPCFLSRSAEEDQKNAQSACYRIKIVYRMRLLALLTLPEHPESMESDRRTTNNEVYTLFPITVFQEGQEVKPTTMVNILKDQTFTICFKHHLELAGSGDFDPLIQEIFNWYLVRIRQAMSQEKESA